MSISTLIRMKQAAGRSLDLDGVQHLKWPQESHDE